MREVSHFFAVILSVLLFGSNPSALPMNFDIDQGASSNAMEYLHKYGYLDTGGAIGQLIDGTFYPMAIKKMQRFAGLKETGILDKETVALMNSSRCGVSDIHSSRSKRFAVHHWKWPKRVLTWRIHNYGNDGIPKPVIRKTFKKSLVKWANVTNLSFKEISSGKPDILFKFALGKHGDPSPFSRPWDGVIAHAYYPKHSTPGLAGDVHFNDDKKFTVNSYKGKDLLWVALHEVGHSLGMEHSNAKGSIMFPYYQSYTGKESELTEDDIGGIQSLYGTKSKTKQPTPEVPFSKCLGKVSASFLSAEKHVYIFSRKKLFILKKTLGIKVGPVSIGKIFKGVKSVDAAFRRHDGNTVLFRKNKYFVFNSNNQYVSGPHRISSSFAGLESRSGRINAAFIWSKTNALYIIKGDKYWRYSLNSNGNGYRLVPGYPKLIKDIWPRVPGKVDAALTWTDGKTYLFKGDKFYQLTKQFTVQNDYPKSTSRLWLKSAECQSNSLDLTEEKSAASIPSQTLLVMVASIFTIFALS
ncbi:interstitial collagenase-like [Rhopilema esculentum]|uniref:interstitial collagenase-like n=1 Tax=Rhopilema esculentum TaxID=499914 RepID=UPI0031D700E6|eukprot:gene9290-16987_t